MKEPTQPDHEELERKELNHLLLQLLKNHYKQADPLRFILQLVEEMEDTDASGQHYGLEDHEVKDILHDCISEILKQVREQQNTITKTLANL